MSQVAILLHNHNLPLAVQTKSFVIYKPGDSVRLTGDRRFETVEYVVVRGFSLYLKLLNKTEPVPVTRIDQVGNAYIRDY